MRVNLQVSYEDRHEARLHGARWDPGRKTWYVIDPEDLCPLMRWLPQELQKAHSESRPKMDFKPLKQKMSRIDSKPGVPTKRTDFSLQDCGCTHVAPWAHCQHSEPALTGDEFEHMRAIGN